MIGCNNCTGLSLTENLSRGNKYLMLDTHFKDLDTHFKELDSFKILENDFINEIEIEDPKDNLSKDLRQSDCSPKKQNKIVSNIHSLIKKILEGNK